MENARSLVSRRPEIIGAFIAAAAAFVVFLPALGNGFVNWDDSFLVYDNQNIRSIGLEFFRWAFSSVVIASWYPLTLASFAIDYAVWGLDPRGFHLTNVILHSVNTFLVALLVFRLVSVRDCIIGRAGKIGGATADRDGLDRAALATAFVTALLFGIHPLRVESVVWVAERKDVLYSLFYLLGIFAYLRYVTRDTRRVSYYLGALALFACSLMSKPMAVTFPAVLLVLDYYPLRRFGPDSRWKGAGRLVFEKAPFFLLSLLVSLVTMFMHQGGAGVNLSLGRILVALRGYSFYLYKMLAPVELAPIYPYPSHSNVSLFSLEYAFPAVLFIVITAFAVRSIKSRPFVSALWFYYVISLLPVIGVFGGGVFAAADRYTYLPGLGPFLLVGLLAGSAFGVSGKKYLRWLTVALVIIVSVASSVLTVKQTHIWKDTITLWTHEIERYPTGSPKPYMNRATAYSRRGDKDLALADYTLAIEIFPRGAEIYSNRGSVFRALGNYDLAIKDFNRAIALNPALPRPYYNRGNAYKKLGDLQAALKDYDRTLELNPLHKNSYTNRGNVHKALGDPARALDDYARALDISPGDQITLYNRADARLMLEDTRGAIEDLGEAIKNNPVFYEAYVKRAALYESLGDGARAKKDYDAARRLKQREQRDAVPKLRDAAPK